MLYDTYLCTISSCSLTIWASWEKIPPNSTIVLSIFFIVSALLCMYVSYHTNNNNSNNNSIEQPVKKHNNDIIILHEWCNHCDHSDGTFGTTKWQICLCIFSMNKHYQTFQSGIREHLENWTFRVVNWSVYDVEFFDNLFLKAPVNFVTFCPPEW